MIGVPCRKPAPDPCSPTKCRCGHALAEHPCPAVALAAVQAVREKARRASGRPVNGALPAPVPRAPLCWLGLLLLLAGCWCGPELLRGGASALVAEAAARIASEELERR